MEGYRTLPRKYCRDYVGEIDAEWYQDADGRCVIGFESVRAKVRHLQEIVRDLAARKEECRYLLELICKSPKRSFMGNAVITYKATWDENHTIHRRIRAAIAPTDAASGKAPNHKPTGPQGGSGGADQLGAKGGE